MIMKDWTLCLFVSTCLGRHVLLRWICVAVSTFQDSWSSRVRESMLRLVRMDLRCFENHFTDAPSNQDGTENMSSVFPHSLRVFGRKETIQRKSAWWIKIQRSQVYQRGEAFYQTIPQRLLSRVVSGILLAIAWIYFYYPSGLEPRNWRLLSLEALDTSDKAAGWYPGPPSPSWQRVLFTVYAVGPTLSWIILGTWTIPMPDLWSSPDVELPSEHHHHKGRKDTVSSDHQYRRQRALAELCIYVVLVRLLEAIVLVAILPRTRLTKLSVPGESLPYLNAILNPAGLLQPGRVDEIRSFLKADLVWYRFFFWALNVLVLEMSLLLTHLCVTCRAPLSVVAHVSQDWYPIPIPTRKLTQWDARKKYAWNDEVTHAGIVYRAMVTQPLGPPQPRTMINRVLELMLWEEEVGPVSTSRMISEQLVKWQVRVLYFTLLVSLVFSWRRWEYVFAHGIAAMVILLSTREETTKSRILLLAKDLGLRTTS